MIMTTFDDLIARKIRKALDQVPDVSERQIIDGVAFFVQGNMCCGIFDGRLVVRVGAATYDRAVREPHAHPIDFTGRPLAGFVYVARDGYATDAALKRWLELGLNFVGTLPVR